jgi:hypothetical protein
MHACTISLAIRIVVASQMGRKTAGCASNYHNPRRSQHSRHKIRYYKSGEAASPSEITYSQDADLIFRTCLDILASNRGLKRINHLTVANGP